MKATYEPTKSGKRLNVRSGAYAAAGIVTKVGAGTYDVESVERGWAKMEGGYADARYLTIVEGSVDGASENEADGREERQADEASENEERQADEDAEPEDERESLRKMTCDELRDLAEKSGIDVPKSAKKDEIIDAIIEGSDD